MKTSIVLLFFIAISFLGTNAFAECSDDLSFEKTVDCIVDEASKENFDTVLAMDREVTNDEISAADTIMKKNVIKRQSDSQSETRFVEVP